MRAQIADFGLSRMVVPKIQGMLQTWQWLVRDEGRKRKNGGGQDCV